MLAVTERLRRMQLDHFAREEGPDGQPWPPLKPETIMARGGKSSKGRRELRGFRRQAARLGVRLSRAEAAMASAAVTNVKMLQDRGTLKSSLAKYATDSEAVVGTNVKYAATHQYGDPSRGIPQRQYLYITESERSELVAMLTDKLIREALRH